VSPESQKTFTGRTRQRKTRLRVRASDTAARALISVGGIGTIVAVSTVFLYLLWVVWPVFQPPKVDQAKDVSLAARQVLRVGVDEYRVLGWTLTADGTLTAFRLGDAGRIESRELGGSAKPTAWAFSIDGTQVLMGFADGTVRLAHVGFTAKLVDDTDVPVEHRNLHPGRQQAVEGGVLVRLEEAFRLHRLQVVLDEPLKIAPGRRIELLDRVDRPTGPILAALSDDNQLHIRSVRKVENMLTGETTYRLSGGKLDLTPHVQQGRPMRLLLSSTGDSVFAAWSNGRLLRFDTRDLNNPRLVEQVNLLGDASLALTRLDWLLGRGTLLAGDSAGRLRAWFRTRVKNEDEGGDGWALVCGQELASPGSAVTAVDSSTRARLAAVGYAGGQVRLFHVTTGNLLVDVRACEGPRGVDAVTVAPKDDAIVALAGGQLHSWGVDLGHPEATMASLFAPVWYEGEPRPAHIWQSSSGDDAFEPKLGMWPLIFGTIKATFYSLIFGMPLALLAAIYTSEFLHPRLRSRVKPTIELMASLPSVVLGFLAALVLAPLVEGVVPAVLTGIFSVPFVILLGAHLWQLLPGGFTRRLAPYRLLFILPTLPAGVLLAWWAGPVLERWFFLGDIKQWLAGNQGSSVGGWLILLLPLAGAAVAIVNSVVVVGWTRRLGAGFDRTGLAVLELGRFVLSAVAAVALALLLSNVLAHLGWDLRGGDSVLGPYVQRNALVVGFIMGFAIIPIIYTIAEDALSIVPEHLRAASLGAGATPWQTAVRIIIPAAMSGLFSAVMVGLGRAVGETMIVLMAAGGTPVMEWNLFNGFRTLSANIAIEMPEAAKDSTHYRTLFLAALVLFVMTFLVNTLAEVVRLRFRKKAYQL